MFLFINTFRLYYKQGVFNIYTVDDFGNLVHVNENLVYFNVKGWLPQ